MTQQPEERLSVAELIRSEVAAKKLALGRYDEILWKIRSGYAVVLYGALSIFLGRDDGPQRASKFLSPELVAAIALFSLLAFLMDINYRRRQLRVVDAANALANLALNIATGEAIEREELRGLLQIAGESGRRIEPRTMWRARLAIMGFYSLTPLVAALLYLGRGR